MKIRLFSWILAGSYLFCGLGICFVVLEQAKIISGFNFNLPVTTKVTLKIGPVGWLCAGLTVGILVALKDLRFRSRFLNPIFTLLLVAWVGYIAFGVLSLLSLLAGDLH
jgi:hypothetical protein